jgi:membrane-associated phospholipid phosphatase
MGINLNMTRHRIFLSFFLIFVCESALFAQNQYNVSQFAHETLDFVKQPGNWRGNDWLKLGAIVAGTALVMQVDQPIRDAVLRDHGRYYHSVPIEAGRIWGEWYTPPIVAGAFGLHGWLGHNASSKKIGFELVQASVYSETITQALKIAFGRARPYQNEGAFSFHPLNISDFGFHSLPGGHNTNGWAMSTVLSRNANSKALKILAYVPAALTFFSRVYQDQHWTSDDFLGAAIGFLVGTWVVDLHAKKEAAVQMSAVYPLTVTFRF